MGGRAPAQTTSTTRQELSPEQRELFTLAMPHLRRHASSEYPLYQGPTVAGFNADQLRAQETYRGRATEGDDLARRAAESQRFMLSTDQLDPRSNPFIATAAGDITRQVQEGLVQRTMPQLRAAGIQAGGMFGGGSTRQQLAEGGAVGNSARELTAQLNNLYMQNYQTGLNNIARAQQLNPSVQAQQLFGANVFDAVGGQRRALEQAMMTDQAQRWALEQFAPYLRSQEILGLLQGMPGGGVTSTNTGATPRGNPVTGALGGAASGAAIGSVVPGVGTALGAILGALAGVGGTYL